MLKFIAIDKHIKKKQKPIFWFHFLLSPMWKIKILLPLDGMDQNQNFKNEAMKIL
jgi:hypothetical protein